MWAWLIAMVIIVPIMDLVWITVKDSEASSNHRHGIIIDGAGTATVDLNGTMPFVITEQVGW
jgi:hypothetical protein